MKMAKTIYLANPYGFSTQQRALLLPPIVAALEELGLEVWEPFARNNPDDFQKAGGSTASARPTSAMRWSRMRSSPSSTASRPTG